MARQKRIRKANSGRPTLYCDEIVNRICYLIATTDKGLPTICSKNDDIPSHETIYKWLFEYPEFVDKYERAKSAQVEVSVEEMKEIADDESVDVPRAKLKIETRKFGIEKLKPKKYGANNLEDRLKEQNEILRTQLLDMQEKLAKEYKRDY